MMKTVNGRAATFALALALSLVLPMATGNALAQGTTWCDGFESYATGTSPSPPWHVSGNTGGITVDGSQRHSGTKSLKMFGQIGGCWGAVADREYSGLPLLITMAVRNGSESLSGCHPYRASCALRTGCPDWWCCPCPELFGFMPNGDFHVSLPGASQTFTGYALNTWHKVKCYLWTPGDGSLHVKYWVNDKYLGEFLMPEAAWMANPAYLDIAVQEGTAWFDDVCVSHELPPAQSSAWERADYDLGWTHFYPYGSSQQVLFSDFSVARGWSVPAR